MPSADDLCFGVMIPSASGISPEAMAELAVAAEQAGVDTIWHGDHVTMPVRIESQYPYGGSPPVADWPFPDVMGVLSYLAGRTKTIRLGTSIYVVPIRHPLDTAKAAATADVLSGGRLRLGVGAGWLREEFEALGYGFFDERWKVLQEHLAAMRAVWRGPASFAGSYCSFPETVCSPAPVSIDGPPLLIAGKSRAALRLAKQYEGWMPYRSEPEEIASGLAEIGLASGFSVVVSVSIRVQPEVEDGASWRIRGPLEHVAARLKAFQDAGATDIQLTDPLEHLRPTLEHVPELIQLVGDRARESQVTGGVGSSRLI